MNQDSEKAFYVYGLTFARGTAKAKSEKGCAVGWFLIPLGKIAAITSVVPRADFEEKALEKNLKDEKWLTQRILNHERVLEEVLESNAVLPFRFGSVFLTQDNVTEALQKSYEDFFHQLEYLFDKQEWGIKVYVDRKIVRAQIARLEGSPTGGLASEGLSYLLERKEEERLSKAVEQALSEWVQKIHDDLKNACIAAKIGNVLPKELTLEKGEMVYQGSFLLEESKLNAFEDCFEILRTQFAPKGLKLEWVGPFPAYNFTDMTLKEARKT